MPPEKLSPMAAGRVLLVGAGPGPVDLMTVRALRAVREAEAVLYDALVDPAVLAEAPPRCLRIQTGKRAGRDSLRQDTINRLMLKLARRGLRVVRLKGGDPSVFGRSGEEAAFLRGHAIAVEVVPGVTAASAAAAQFGFPLTHRDLARGVTLATARISNGEVVADGWNAKADAGTTLALYMARDSAAAIARALVAAGRSPATPTLSVENAGRDDARLVRSTLRTLEEDMAAARFDGPVVILVGEVCLQAERSASATIAESVPQLERGRR